MAKTIVTHISPDFDGIPAIWLLKKFHPDFKDAKVDFIPAGGQPYNNEPVDSNPDILHVDVGGGRFDHHNTNDYTCGAKLVYEWLVNEGYVNKDDKALLRLIDVVTQIDHAHDTVKWPDPASDIYEFSLHNVLSGLKIVYGGDYEKYIAWTIESLESVYKLLTAKVAAEEDLEKAQKFQTRWGKAAATESGNDMVIDVAIRSGYALVVRKDPKKGYIRITGSNKHDVDLTKAYEMFKKQDPIATWFLHASKVLLRNGSTKNPTMKPTKLTLSEIIKILEKS